MTTPSQKVTSKERKKKTIKWQYKSILDPDYEQINSLGEDGWEIFKIDNETFSELFGLIKASYPVYYFRKQIEDSL